MDSRSTIELTAEERERARKALRAMALADEKLAEGSEFKKPKSSEFYAKTRDRLQRYGETTRVSLSQLEWLQDIAEQELKRCRQERP